MFRISDCEAFVIVKLEGENLRRFLNICASNNIVISQIEIVSKYCIYAKIKLIDVWELPPILRKTKTRILVVKRKGIGFVLKKIIKHKICICILFVVVLLVINYNLRIWNIHIQGNTSIKKETIINLLEDNDISKGIYCNKIDNSYIEKIIKTKIENVVWSNCFVEGTTLNIRIKEADYNNSIQKKSSNNNSPIYSKKEAIIKSIILRNGVTDLKVGDTVKKGDLLVKNTIPVEDDFGNIEKYLTVKPDADIVGYVIYDVNIFKKCEDSKDIEKKYLEYQKELQKNGVSIIFKNVIMIKEKNGYRITGEIYGYENICNYK